MSIYDASGSEVRIIGAVGAMKPLGLHALVTLVKVKYNDGQQDFKFAEFLEADDGYSEIIEALQHVPQVTVAKHEILDAIGMAYV